MYGGLYEGDTIRNYMFYRFILLVSLPESKLYGDTKVSSTRYDRDNNSKNKYDFDTLGCTLAYANIWLMSAPALDAVIFDGQVPSI